MRILDIKSVNYDIDSEKNRVLMENLNRGLKKDIITMRYIENCESHDLNLEFLPDDNDSNEEFTEFNNRLGVSHVFINIGLKVYNQ